MDDRENIDTERRPADSLPGRAGPHSCAQVGDVDDVTDAPAGPEDAPVDPAQPLNPA